MKIIYVGSMSGCFIEGTIEAKRGETVEVPDKIARQLLKERPKEFETLHTGDKASKKKN